MTIARFGNLFANMHHCVHAVAGALRRLNVACPHPDVSTGSCGCPLDGQCEGYVIDAEFALRRCQCVDFSLTKRIFFLCAFALLAKNVAIDLKCIENHRGELHS